MMTDLKVHFTSNSDDWATPQYLVDWSKGRFFRSYRMFDLDVCASDSNHKASKYYTVDDDGLKQAWHGNVWLNPPYGRVIGQWIDKAVNEVARGEVASITLCVPARVETKWWHNMISNGAEVVFIKGRVKFGDGKSSAPFPSALVHLSQLNTGVVKTTYEVVE